MQSMQHLLLLSPFALHFDRALGLVCQYGSDRTRRADPEAGVSCGSNWLAFQIATEIGWLSLSEEPMKEFTETTGPPCRPATGNGMPDSRAFT